MEKKKGRSSMLTRSIFLLLMMMFFLLPCQTTDAPTVSPEIARAIMKAAYDHSKHGAQDTLNALLGQGIVTVLEQEKVASSSFARFFTGSWNVIMVKLESTGEYIAGFEGTSSKRNVLGDILDEVRPPQQLLDKMGKLLDGWLKEHTDQSCFSTLLGHSEGGLFAKFVKVGWQCWRILLNAHDPSCTGAHQPKEISFKVHGDWVSKVVGPSDPYPIHPIDGHGPKKSHGVANANLDGISWHEVDPKRFPDTNTSSQIETNIATEMSKIEENIANEISKIEEDIDNKTSKIEENIANENQDTDVSKISNETDSKNNDTIKIEETESIQNNDDNSSRRNEEKKKFRQKIKNEIKTGFASGCTRAMLENKKALEEENYILYTEKVVKDGAQTSFISGALALTKESAKLSKICSSAGAAMMIYDTYQDIEKGELSSGEIMMKTGMKIGSACVISATIVNPWLCGIVIGANSYGVDQLFKPNLNKYVGFWSSLDTNNVTLPQSFEIMVKPENDSLIYVSNDKVYHLKNKNGKYLFPDKNAPFKSLEIVGPSDTNLRMEKMNSANTYTYQNIPYNADIFVGEWEYYDRNARTNREFTLQLIEDNLLYFYQKIASGKSCFAYIKFKNQSLSAGIRGCYQGLASGSLITKFYNKKDVSIKLSLCGREMYITCGGRSVVATPKAEVYYCVSTDQEDCQNFRSKSAALCWYANKPFGEYSLVWGMNVTKGYSKIMKCWSTDYYKTEMMEKVQRLLRLENQKE